MLKLSSKGLELLNQVLEIFVWNKIKLF
jgi:hypothetical protein